jgi:MFS family permease
VPRITISYRRQDSAGITGRIFDRLSAHYGDDTVFIDIDKIPLGTDFRHHIQDQLAQTDVLLAIVGPRWLGEEAGRSRIKDLNDPVRVEIETAFRRGLTVIPVLVDGATMPSPADLPDTIADFAYRNAAMVDSGRDFNTHVGRLMQAIDRLPAPKPAAPTPSPIVPKAAAAVRADVPPPTKSEPPAPVPAAADDVVAPALAPAPAKPSSARSPSEENAPMAVRSDVSPSPQAPTSYERPFLLIAACSVGTMFVWYDFYIYGTLGFFLARYFFANVSPDAGFVFALLAFAAGFAVRPFGALIFGRIGDTIGRKYALLVTMSLIGAGTFCIGVLPGYANWGMLAPIVLIGLRLIQGFALGGEYGGAAIYVAEHAPPNRRGRYTAWIQTTATFGLFMTILLILGIRSWIGEAAFADWGWRVPFLLSSILLAVALWIRLKFTESPLFARMVSEGKQSKRPLADTFGQWSNLKIAILALLGATAGEAVVWYGGQFYALFFLTQTLKVPGVTAQTLIAIALGIGAPSFIVFGALSDRIGRKPIMLAGFALAAVTYFFIFQGLTHFANPKLETALATAPVTVTAYPGDCSFQFKTIGTEKFTTSCDQIKSALANLSVNYTTLSAPAGTTASVKVGSQTITADAPNFTAAIAAAVRAQGYPASADPNDINYPMTVLLLVILVVYVGMVYGPIAAWLVELFPTRIRYTGFSLSYHIGNGWFGGFLPATIFAIIVATGNVYAGLWYPIAVAAMSFVVALIFLPETKDRDLARI